MTVADSGIDRRGGGGGSDICRNLYTPQLALYALEGSGGMLPRKILKSKASNDAF